MSQNTHICMHFSAPGHTAIPTPYHGHQRLMVNISVILQVASLLAACTYPVTYGLYAPKMHFVAALMQLELF